MIYKARKGQTVYGQGIGILMLDTQFQPLIPGDVGNACTFDFQVTYEVVEGLTVDRATSKDPTALEILLVAGEKLAKGGVKAITSNCGYLGFFQQDLAGHLDVPVFMSSLLQLPLISAMIGHGRKVGVLCAREATFDQSLLERLSIDPEQPIVVRGMDQWEHFCQALMIDSGELDAARIEAEIVAAARKMVEEDSSIGAILLECACMPPYSRAVQKAVNLPIFDFITMINYVFSAMVQKKFEGFM